MTSPTLHIVQLTDLHLFGSPDQVWKDFNTYQSFQSVIAEVKALAPRPDILILTGDLSQDETLASYAHLRRLIGPLKLPTYWISGNHDQLEIAREVLSGDSFRRDRAFEQRGWRFLLLNSAIPGQVHGELVRSELDWLAEQLAQHPTQPTIIAIHHPPVPIQSQWMDQIGLHHPEEFLSIVDRHPQVRGVMFGHIHQASDTTRNGVRYVGCPSTCIQFVPVQREMSLDTLTPGFRQFVFFSDGTWDTQITRVPVLR